MRKFKDLLNFIVQGLYIYIFLFSILYFLFPAKKNLIFSFGNDLNGLTDLFLETVGSCWAFASVGAMEALNAIRTGKLVTFSAQELVDCDNNSNGCFWGGSYDAFDWVKNNGGISEEAAYPYVARKGTCKANTTVCLISFNLIHLNNKRMVKHFYCLKFYIDFQFCLRCLFSPTNFT